MADIYKIAAELMKDNPGMKSYEALKKAKEIKESSQGLQSQKSQK